MMLRPLPKLTQVFSQLLALFYLRLERERNKRPPAKLGKLGERLDPGETKRVKLRLSLARVARRGDREDVPWQIHPP